MKKFWSSVNKVVLGGITVIVFFLLGFLWWLFGPQDTVPMWVFSLAVIIGYVACVIVYAVDEKKFEVSAVATTNYNRFISDILRIEVAFLNGSTETWYDPYLNRIGTKSELTTSENHILVPLMFTQSGTKPMTSIEMSMKYVDTYTQWKNSDRVIIVGFGFGTDDEHINGILRTLIDVDNKEITVVTLDKHQSDDTIAKDIARKLKVTNVSNISIIQVDVNGINIQDKKIWTDALSSR